jgi:hypothetical protein
MESFPKVVAVSATLQNHFPTLRGGFPMLQNCFPTLGNDFPRLRNHFPNLRIAPKSRDAFSEPWEMVSQYWEGRGGNQKCPASGQPAVQSWDKGGSKTTNRRAEWQNQLTNKYDFILNRGRVCLLLIWIFAKVLRAG